MKKERMAAIKKELKQHGLDLDLLIKQDKMLQRLVIMGMKMMEYSYHRTKGEERLADLAIALFNAMKAHEQLLASVGMEAKFKIIGQGETDWAIGADVTITA